MEKKLISIREVCTHHHLDDSFFRSLEESAIVDFVMVETERYIQIEELPKIEKIIRLHDDLGVNMEGIEVIKHLLDRTEQLQQTIRELRNRLSLYE